MRVKVKRKRKTAKVSIKHLREVYLSTVSNHTRQDCYYNPYISLWHFKRAN